MEKDERLCKEHQILVCLCSLPRRILSLHESGNVTEFVLHDLSAEICFNWSKAAYFVDNPDFDCLKGIAGYSKAESYTSKESIWENPREFSIHMKTSPFNQKVKRWSCESCQRSKKRYDTTVDPIAEGLGFNNYGFYDWDIKYGNHGILIYENQSSPIPLSEECIQNGICFLGLCPLF